jgi:hypothetical protein
MGLKFPWNAFLLFTIVDITMLNCSAGIDFEFSLDGHPSPLTFKLRDPLRQASNVRLTSQYTNLLEADCSFLLFEIQLQI